MVAPSLFESCQPDPFFPHSAVMLLYSEIPVIAMIKDYGPVNELAMTALKRNI